MIWGRGGGGGGEGVGGGLIHYKIYTFLTGREMPGFKEATREWFR